MGLGEKSCISQYPLTSTPSKIDKDDLQAYESASR